MDAVFAALAHPGRRRMLDLLVATPGLSVKALASHFDTSRIATLKHLRVLAAAGLVLSEREGRTRRLFFNSVPIQLIHERWSTSYGSFWAQRMTEVRASVEGRGEARKRKGA